MSAEQPNNVVFLWDTIGWGELGYGGTLLRGSPTPAVDRLASEQLLNFNVEAQGTPGRSALLTGRHEIGTMAPPRRE